MPSRSARLLSSLFVLILVAPALLAHDVTLTGTQSFASIDGSANDHDGAVNGVFTVNDGNLIVNGVVNCNDDGPGGNSACAMSFAVSGNMSVGAGGALYAENRSGGGNGGAITLTVGGNLALTGNAVVSSASTSNAGNANGGNISANVAGSVSVGAGSTIDSGSAGAVAGNITVAAGGVVSVDGNVVAGPSRTVAATRLTGVALTGGGGNQRGGQISIASITFVEPALVVGAAANVVSQGEAATGSVTLDGCGVDVRGLVASLSRSNAATVTIRSGKSASIDGRDLGGAGIRMGRVRADSTQGTAAANRVDVFASDAISVYGPAAGLFAVTSNTGTNDPKGGGGSVRVIALAGSATAGGNAIDAGGSNTGNGGGSIAVDAAGDAVLNTATLRAAGDHTSNNNNRNGGSIRVRSYAGNVLWTNGVGDVRPLGSTSNLPLADQGSIVLTACGTVNTTGSSFPVNGTATSVHPQTATGVCSPNAPSLPAGTPALVTCNTPPVANDTAASTNEDNSVTVTMTGTDADGDTLTFTIVSGPANGSLGPVVFVNATTSTVLYTPNANYNGGDSFVFQANDGNGGTDTATAVISVAAVNDPPSFQAGPTITVLEDAGPQTYANWATSISAGPADESGQSVTFTVTNSNPSLFSVQPALASNGTLTFTPALNAYGTATITVTAQDNGGTLNGGNDTSASQSSSITITPVNDAPSFVKGADQTVNEDAGPQTVPGWATSISAGPNEGSQTVSFVTANNNSALFSSQPAVSSSGTLTYTPAANTSGTATVTIYAQDNGGTANGGVDSSAPQTFTITVNSVNDAPSFTSGGNVTVNEDSGAYSAAWATAISAGPADESGQTVSFSTSNSNNALFSVQPSISPSGVLSFTLNANVSGSATVTVTLSDNGGTANGGVDTSAPQTFSISVSSINDEPSFTPGANQTSNEDAGPQTVAGWATAISAGPADESGQTITFVTTNDNNALFSSQPSVAPDGTLTYTAAANANGTATVTVYAQDNGGTANGGDDTSASYTFTITIVAVNDAPSFTGGGNVTVNEDSGAYSAAWATAISAGPADESGQTLTFNVTSSNPSLFASGPSISSTGVLSFTLNANAFGSSTITVTLSDNGGTANGGVDTSASQTFTITVNAVNDAPSFVGGGDVTVNEDSGPYAAAWASSISAGPNEGSQLVSFSTTNNNNALFAVQPAISPTGVLTFTTALNAYGTATVTVTLSDNGGTANGGVDTSAPQTFTITVNAVNDGPTAAADSWETLGNTEIRVDLAAGVTPHVSDTTPSGNGVRDNDTDPEGDPTLVTGIVGCADVTAPFDCTLAGGAKVSMLPNGSFSYTPAPGATSGSFQYTVTDVPSAGLPATATGTVTFTIHDMIWYVNGAAAPGGNGTSSAPFVNFASLNGVGDVDAAGQTIFVHTSAVAGSIDLEAGQKLYGQGVGLSKPNNLNGNGAPTVLVAPGVNPTVTSAADVVTVDNVAGVEIAGLTLSSAGGNGIDVTSNPFGSPAGAAIYSNTIAGAGAEGIDINAGNPSTNVITINNTSITSTGNGLDVSSFGTTEVAFTNGTILSSAGSGIFMDGSGGSLTVTGLANMTIDGNTAGDGIRIDQATFDAVGGGSFSTVNTGVVTVGSAGNPVGGNGVLLTSVSGDLAFGTLTVFGGTTGAQIFGSGLYTGAAGMRVTSGGGSITAPAGIGLGVTNATIGAGGLNFTSINAAGGVNGIVLNNTGAIGGLKVTGTGSANSGGLIQNASGDGILLSSTANVNLTDMRVLTSGQSHIDATNVTGLTLTRVSTDLSTDHGIRGSNVRNLVISGGIYDRGGAGSAVSGVHGVFITDLLGNSSVTGATFRRSNTIQFRVSNSTATAAAPGVPDVLTLSGTTFDTHTSPFAGDHLSVASAAGGNLRLVTNTSVGINSFSGAGNAIQATADTGATLDLSSTGVLSNNNTGGYNVAGTTGGKVTFSIFGNKTANGTGISNSGTIGINVVSVNGGVMSGTVSDNTVSNAAFAGIQTLVEGNGSLVVAVNNNAVSGGFANFGVRGQARLGTGLLSLNLNNNVVNGTNPGALSGVSIESGASGSGHTNTVCLNMANNTSTLSNGSEGYRLRQRTGTTFNLQNFVGNGASTTDVANWVNVTKSNSGSTNIIIASSFSAAPGACATP